MTQPVDNSVDTVLCTTVIVMTVVVWLYSHNRTHTIVAITNQMSISRTDILDLYFLEHCVDVD